MNIKLLPIVLVLTLSPFLLRAQDLFINEVMYSNTNMVQDDNEEFNDWIELYNASDDIISLLGYGLSDDSNDLLKWTFPDVFIEAHGFILVFANNESEDGELVASFNLDSSGEALILSTPEAEILDELSDEVRPTNISMGRVPDGGDIFGELLYPSPDYSNLENNIILFSDPAGYYIDSLSLQLVNSSNEDEEIYYTIDGSVPNENSTQYSNSIELSSRAGDPNCFSEIITALPQNSFVPTEEIFKINILRVVSYRDGVLSSPVYSRSYLIDENIFEKYDFSLVSLITDSANFFNFDTGIYVPGAHFMGGDSQWTGNYMQRGIEWERDVHIEFFEQDGELSLNQNCGVRIHGGGTRVHRQKSLQLFARKEYGHKHFNHQFFADIEKDEYKRVILRTSTACWDYTVIKDGITNIICKGLDFENSHIRPVVVFLNGEYWGLHELKDVLGPFHLADLYDADENSMNILRFGSGIHPNHGSDWGIIEGSNVGYIELMSYIEDYDLANQGSYEYVKTKMDISSLIDYYCTEIFFNNKDWLTNNHKVWKSNEVGSKWRWLFFDFDSAWGFKPNDWNLLANNLSPTENHPNAPTWATMLLRNLMVNKEFKEQFLWRMACLLKGTLSEENILNKLNAYIELVDPGINDQVNRWDIPSGVNVWNESLSSHLTEFAEEREEFLTSHIEQQFNIEFNLDEYNCDTTFVPSKDIVFDSNEILVFPNPTTHSLYIRNSSDDEIKKIELFDSEGQIVLSINKHSVINMASVPSGLYLLKISRSDEVICKKVMKN